MENRLEVTESEPCFILNRKSKCARKTMHVALQKSSPPSINYSRVKPRAWCEMQTELSENISLQPCLCACSKRQLNQVKPLERQLEAHTAAGPQKKGVVLPEHYPQKASACHNETHECFMQLTMAPNSIRNSIRNRQAAKCEPNVHIFHRVTSIRN